MSGGSSVVSTAVPPIGHAIGGALGSAIALLLFYPLERARIEMQTNVVSADRKEISNLAKASAGFEADNEGTEKEAIVVMDDEHSSPNSQSSLESWVSCVDLEQETLTKKDKVLEHPGAVTVEPPKTKQDGLVPTLSRLYKRRELYQGAASIVITLATSSFVFFYAHQMLQELLIERNTKKTAILSLLGSSVAGMVNVLITNPLWVANVKIVKGSHLSLWKELHTIVKSEGWTSLWNGTGASMLLVSNPVLQFFVYEQAKASRLKTRATLSPLEAFCIGALAKAIATIATYPLQLAQILLRLQKGGGTWDCLKDQYNRGGVPALYTGMNAKLLQTVLTAAFTFLTYEQILRVVRVGLLMTAQKRKRQQVDVGSNI